MSDSALHDTDFYAWTQQQCQALTNKAWANLEWLNLQKELESLRKLVAGVGF